MSDNLQTEKLKKEKSSDARVFYISLIAAVATVQIILKIFIKFVPDADSQVFSRIIEGVMSVFALFFAFKTTFVQPWLGLKVEKDKAKRTIISCVSLTAGIILLFVAARLILQQFSSEVAERPFFGFYFDIKHRVYYFVSVLVQEVLAKGVLQYGIEKTLPEDKWYIALPSSALVFGMLHIYHSLYYILGAIAIALISGVFYHRQKNIWASYALHFLIAFLPRCFGLK